MGAIAAPSGAIHFVSQTSEGSQLRAGDSLVANGDGKVRLVRDRHVIATLNDPEDVVGHRTDARTPLYITDAEGNRVRGDLASSVEELYVSRDAPQIIMRNRNAAVASSVQAHGGGGSANMTLHGGNVLVTNKTMAILWGSWGNPGDIISGIDSLLGGWGGSGMAGDSTEYYGTTNGNVTKTSTYLGHTIDSTSPPSRALSTSGAVSEACKITGNAPDPNAVYFIYTSTGAGHVSYCAWHSWGACSNGAPIQVAYMPNITGIAGCDPVSDVTSESEGLAALANVTTHELSEAITDPRGAGWFDSGGAENGDKCAWSFHNDVSLGGKLWKIQMEWSNAAYTAGTGYANGSGQKACLQ